MRSSRLPQRAEVVYDLYHARALAHDTTEFQVELLPASTALYYTGAAGALKSLPEL